MGEPELLSLLVAYPYMNAGVIREIASVQDATRFLLDSGAFTAWKSGKPIELDSYCKFIETLEVKPWRYFTLDVIGDPGKTMENYRAMLRRGFKPIPIFTRGEDLGVIDEYYKTSDVVAIGGLVGTPGNRGFVNGIMKKIGKRRCHWLGFTSLDFIKHYGPYMCDSSSWESGARYGSITLYMGRGRTKQFSKKDFSKTPSPALADAIRSYGVNPSELSTTAGWAGGYSPSRRLNAFSATRMAADAQAKVGTLYFSAATVVPAIRLLSMGHAFEQKRRHR